MNLQELFPGTFLPTAAHYFMRLLADKGLLLRCYTQNIDALELQAGVPAERVVAAHGSFDGEWLPSRGMRFRVTMGSLACRARGWLCE